MMHEVHSGMTFAITRSLLVARYCDDAVAWNIRMNLGLEARAQADRMPQLWAAMSKEEQDEADRCLGLLL